MRWYQYFYVALFCLALVPLAVIAAVIFAITWAEYKTGRRK